MMQTLQLLLMLAALAGITTYTVISYRAYKAKNSANQARRWATATKLAGALVPACLILAALGSNIVWAVAGGAMAVNFAMSLVNYRNARDEAASAEGVTR